MISFIQFVLYNFVIYVSMFFAQDVRIEIIAPDEAEAGSSFIVEIRISKDIMEGAARLQQDFPVGYQVTSRDSHYGNSTFKEQKLKVIWFKIPTDTAFTISYLVQVDPTSDGLLELGGTFSFLEDSIIKTVNIPVKKILIIPSGQQQANNLPDSTDINSLSDPQRTLCFRQVVKEGDDYIVNLLVKRGEIENDKFAKIQETVQSGFRAEYIETKGGVFSFKENNVKLLWMSLPAEQQFIIKYKLSPETPGTVPELSGTFSYIFNEITKFVQIKNVNFLDFPLLADITNNNQNQNNNQNNQNNNNQNNNNQNQDITPESGIYYKVQIAAARQVRVNPKYYFRQFNVTEKVQLEMHEGWRKYLIGKFNVYKDARDHRVYIWQNTPIKDAFVAAYNNGTRITVQEALMIANQKWVQ